MGKEVVKFGTIREAYCALRRCRSQRFEIQVMWRSFPWLKRPIAWVFWWIERPYFQRELEAIKAAGSARNASELEGSIDEFENLMGVERGIRRTILKLRISGDRLARVLGPMLDHLEETPSPTMDDLPPRPSVVSDSREGASVALRRLRKIRDDFIEGRPLETVLKELGLTQSELRSQLEAHSPGRPDLIWFLRFFEQADEYAILRTENERLTRLAAELSARLLERDGSPQPSHSMPTTPKPPANF